MVLVGKKAPEFTAKAVIKDKIVDDFSLSSLKGKYVILFFYPLDFTFVCPTELHAFQERLEDFKQRGAEVVGCSVDSPYSHLAWLETPKSKGGIEGIEYPILSDLKKDISENYGVLIPHEGIAYRGLFLIDKEGTVRHQVVNDLPIGRSVDEALRTLEALIFYEQNGEVCPANWEKGKKSMKPDSSGLKKYFAGAAQ
ncbi:MAG: putative peroxiredoxin [Chlamydiae bacterium]|nr:putative peroxiredoxin [Chlamydiota bacterium]